MITVVDLWLPILLSAVFVFVASSIIHMVLPIHRRDFGKLPSEADVLDAMRRADVGPGDYMFPCPASMKDMNSPEMLARYQQGPVGSMTVVASGAPSIGRSLWQWFVFSLVVSLFAGYVTSLALPRGTDYLMVFRVAGAVAVLGYAVTNVTNSIWKGQCWGTTWKYVFDGVVYGLVTGGTFGWLWPRLT